MIVKALLYFFVGLMGVYYLAIGADRAYAFFYRPTFDISDSVWVETGDILFRSNSYFLVENGSWQHSGFPGHVAIVVSEGRFPGNDPQLGNVLVIEAAKFNRRKKWLQNDVSVNLASDNFGVSGSGKRILLKMHLSNGEKKQLLGFLGRQIKKPYSLFAEKYSQQGFNCATLVWQSILKATGKDLDADGGQYVFPTDIAKSSYFSKSDCFKF